MGVGENLTSVNTNDETHIFFLHYSTSNMNSDIKSGPTTISATPAATSTTPTTQCSQQFQLLVNTIETTFKGNSKVNNILSSLQSLFTIFDNASTTNALANGDGVSERAVLDSGTQRKEQLSDGTKHHFEREMLLGVITMLLNHLIKGLLCFDFYRIIIKFYPIRNLRKN